MTGKRMIGMGALLMAMASTSAGQQLLAHGGRMVEAMPIRAAKVDGNGKQIGPWVYLHEQGSSNRDDGALDVIFDTFENDRSDELWNSPPGADTYGPPTMAGADRWFFGWGYAGNSIIGDQFKLNPVMRGRMAPFMQHAWAQSYTERLYLFVRTAETFGYNTLPAIDGHLSGVVFDMGVLEEYTVYVLSADLRGTGLEFQIGGDLDNNGAHQVSYAGFYDGSNLIYSQGNQPMLWGTRGTNPSQNHTYEWWDDDPGNGIFDLWECYEMWFGVEPDPLAMMIAFYGYRPSPDIVRPQHYEVGPPGKEIGDHDVTKLLDADGIEVNGRNTITGSNEQPSLLMRIGFARDNADRVYQLATTVTSRGSIANIQQRVGYARWDNVSSVIYVDTHTFTTGQLDAVRTATLNDPATLAQVIHPDSGGFKVVTAYRKIGLVPSLRYDVYVDQIVAEVQH